jgi:hypothetical protein
MKEEQADLERKLWTERRDIFKKYEDKVNAARTKCVVLVIIISKCWAILILVSRANMIGGGISKHEADVCHLN